MNANRSNVVKGTILLSSGLAALAITGAVDGRTTAPSANAVVAKLKAKHGSGVSGTATLTALRKGVRVVLRLSGPVRNNSLAHIHTGPCRREPTFANPRISSSLNYVVKGKSVTTVTLTTLRSLRTRSYSINVHDPGSYAVVACADIPRA